QGKGAVAVEEENRDGEAEQSACNKIAVVEKILPSHHQTGLEALRNAHGRPSRRLGQHLRGTEPGHRAAVEEIIDEGQNCAGNDGAEKNGFLHGKKSTHFWVKGLLIANFADILCLSWTNSKPAHLPFLSNFFRPRTPRDGVPCMEPWGNCPSSPPTTYP